MLDNDHPRWHHTDSEPFSSSNLWWSCCWLKQLQQPELQRRKGRRPNWAEFLKTTRKTSFLGKKVFSVRLLELAFFMRTSPSQRKVNKKTQNLKLKSLSTRKSDCTQSAAASALTEKPASRWRLPVKVTDIQRKSWNEREDDEEERWGRRLTQRRMFDSAAVCVFERAAGWLSGSHSLIQGREVAARRCGGSSEIVKCDANK